MAKNKMDPNGPFVHRPDPPRDLNAAEATEWREMVASMPPAYFAGAHYPRLAQFCRHTVEARHISQLIAACRKPKKTDINEYVKLLTMELKESDMILRLMRSMRLTHQAVYRADSHSHCLSNFCGLRGQTRGPHLSNLISALLVSARRVLYENEARFVNAVALVDKPGNRWNSWTRN